LNDPKLELKERIGLENELRANRIQVITTLVQALGGIAVLVGIYFAWANLKTTQRAEKDTQKTQAEALRISNEGQITERFTKAIEQLGATDDKGNPRLELRLGGIYALERIARDSEKDHWPIMEVLTTYVREHAPIRKTEEKSGSDGANQSNNANRQLATPIATPSPDIQAILTVIGRRDRTFEEEKLNLAGTNLEGADLINAHLEGAILWNAHLEGAHLKSVINLTQGQIDSANGNEETELPPGIVMPESWKHVPSHSP
jgi:hypothetical protein